VLFHATTAPIRCLALLSVLIIHVADEHPSLKARAWPLEAVVVRLYSVVILGRRAFSCALAT
jgi:hypothetical protein